MTTIEEAHLDLDQLVTGPEFEIYSQGRATAVTVAAWRRYGKIEIRGTKGKAALHRLGDLIEVERTTRVTAKVRGGRVRKPRPRASAA